MGKENSRSSGEVLAVKFFFFLINVEIIANLFFFFFLGTGNVISFALFASPSYVFDHYNEGLTFSCYPNKIS